MNATMVVALSGFAAVSGIASWQMAVGKSRRIWLWTSVGLIFNVPGMLAVAFLPSHRSSAEAAVVAALEQPPAPPDRMAA
jgi:hypothetical protein